MHSRVYITLKQNGTHNVLRPHVERHVGHDRARIGCTLSSETNLSPQSLQSHVTTNEIHRRRAGRRIIAQTMR